MRLGGASLRTWCVDERGLTGAEKALLLCVALALLGGVGHALTRGSTQAGGDARRTLMAGGGESSALGRVVDPMAAGAIAAAAPPEETHFVSTPVSETPPTPPAPAAPPAPPAAPPKAPRLRSLSEITTDKDGRASRVDFSNGSAVEYRRGPDGKVSAIVLYPPKGQDSPQAALWAQHFGPGKAQPSGGVEVWSAERGGTPRIDDLGGGYVEKDGKRLVLQADGSAFLGDVASGKIQWAGDPQPPPPPKPYVGSDPPAQLGNFRELAEFVCDRYKTGAPIGIIKIASIDNAYLVVLSGTEFLADGGAGPKQATYIPEDLRSAFGAADDYRDNVLRAMAQHKIPKGASIFVAGHSLGGMEAQNLIVDKRFLALYKPLAVTTYGSPLTTRNQPGVPTNRFSTPSDPVAKLSPMSAPDTIARTAAWGGHYLLRLVDSNPPRPPAPIWERYQTIVGKDEGSSIERHNAYRSLPELEQHPLVGPDNKPLRLDTSSFRTYTNPRNTIDILPLGRFKR